MSSKCTIYCETDDPQRIIELAGTKIDKGNICTDSEIWKTLSIKTANSNIRFTRLIREVAGDSFCQLILSTYNKFRIITTQAVNEQKNLLEMISRCQLIIGVVVEPKFDETSNHYDLIFEIAKKLEGVILTKDGMINCNGKMIIDYEGNTEINLA
jgi:hypothetical protein